MTTLETNIVEQARQHLLELRGALLLPKGQGRSEGISSAFWMLNGLVLLANNTSNGMTESSVQELHAIDLEAGQAMAAAKLWGEL